MSALLRNHPFNSENVIDSHVKENEVHFLIGEGEVEIVQRFIAFICNFIIGIDLFVLFA